MRMMPVATALLFLPLTISAQTLTNSASLNEAALHNYESCTFDDGLQIVKIDSLPPGVQERTVQTKDGPKPIRMAAGRRIMFAYGVGGDFFANVKPEQLPDDTWATEKQTLLDELNAMLTSDHDSLPNAALPQQMHGLEIHGFDRSTLKGGVLGFYLLFDNARHIATSVYLLNQEPITRRFQTIEQYRALRTRFLTAYTGCVAQNQNLHAPSTKDGR